MPVRIGVVDYLNSWPLAWGFLSDRIGDDFEPSYHPPARVADLLAEGSLDVGLVPSIEVQRLPDLMVVPGLCVAATHEVRSVLLVANRPVEEIRSVALDENSRTSAALVDIVLSERFGVEAETTTASPDVERMLSDADAALVIGDPALAVDRERYVVLDLAAEWRLLTGRPFVFAVWAARADVASPELTVVLDQSLGLGLEEMDRIIARAVDELGLAEEVVERYLLRHLRFAMGAAELEGLEEFFRRAAARGAIERVEPLRFV
ncbi:MAG: menaquinone biosynthesis protein [Thermoanaerobaculia bacterium]|nr:menaquinone biosynthesis protein [Thermoanaerobaculia bacterium]